MRVSCVKCGCRFDISNRDVLAMADKLRAKHGTPPAPSLSPVADGNVRADNAALERESIARRFLADNKGGGRGEPTEDDLEG